MAAEHHSREMKHLDMEDPMRAGVRSLWEQDLLFDYTICVEDQEFRVHKVAMAALSDYFRAMLTSGMAESGNDNVQIQGVKASAFKTLIEFIYTNHLDMTGENAPDILAAAMFFQVQRAVDVCSQFMVDSLNVENWFDIFNLLQQYNLKAVVKDIMTFVISNMGDIIQSSTISELSYKGLRLLVDNWHRSELDLFLLIVNWVKGDLEAREIYMNDLLGSVRFALMTSDELLNIRNLKEENHNSHFRSPLWQLVICWMEQCGLVDRALEYHSLPLCKRVLDETQQSRVRSAPTFVSMSGRKGEGCYYEHFEKRCFIQHDGLFLLDKMEDIYECHEMNNFLVAVSYEFRGDNWCLFDPRIMEWVDISKLPRDFDNAVLVHDKRHLYTVGGHESQDYSYIIETIEQYDFETDTWTNFGRLPVPVMEFGACIFQDGLYISGGYRRDRVDQDGWKQLSSMDRLDLASKIWEAKAPMLVERSSHEMNVMKIQGEEVICIFDKSYNLEYYSATTDQWARLTFNFDVLPPDRFGKIYLGNEWVRGNSIYFSQYHRTGVEYKACVVVTFPEDGDKAVVSYHDGIKERDGTTATVLAFPQRTHLLLPAAIVDMLL